MEQTLTMSIQDYLKNIYELTENGEIASTNAARQSVECQRALCYRNGAEARLHQTCAR